MMEVLLVVFVVVTLLLVLAALGAYVGPEAQRPYYHNGSFVLIVIDLCILGWVLFNGHGGR